MGIRPSNMVKEDLVATTLHAMFVESARAHADRTGFIQKVRGAWSEVSYASALERVEAIGAGLGELGVGPGGRASILAASRMEWTLADYAILGAGATVVPIYQTNSPGECAYVLQDSDATLVFVEDAGQLEKVRSERAQLPTLRHVVVFDADGVDLDEEAGEMTLAELERRGAAAGPDAWYAGGATATPDTIATLIYTSGTTGPPKGCMLSHRNYMTMTAQGVDPANGLFLENDRMLLFLPLAHTFARLAQFAATSTGSELAYTSIASLMDDMAEVKPTLVPCVPRVFEKAYTRVLGQFNEATGTARKLIDRGLKVGALRGRYVAHGRRVPPLLAAQHAFFHRVIFSKIHARFGGNIRLFISGGAPLSREVAEFFLACGLVIVEGYGLTESTTAVAVNHPDNFRLGSVGRVFNGTSTKIAEDGELLVKGDIVFQGYYKNDEATAEVLDADGWLHTGDIADFDREGFLYITDRKKDIIITAGGKNISPANIENALKSTQYISQALVFGDRKPYLTALITLDPLELETWAQTHGVDNDMFELIANPDVQALVAEAVKHANDEVGRVEQVKRYRILPLDFTQETGELTPKLSMKRKVVVERYGQWIEDMYAPDAADADAVVDRRILDLQDSSPVTA
ncbi:MAG: long-chain fatty acid--CoA ligase [Thermoleophilia bacterium]|nr:long-chain fatty acid--CoA ligase [Thermoleophilia bacterium]